MSGYDETQCAEPESPETAADGGQDGAGPDEVSEELEGSEED